MKARERRVVVHQRPELGLAADELVASELLEANERGLGTAPEQLGDRPVHRERRGHASVPR